MNQHRIKPDVNFRTRYLLTHNEWKWDIISLFPNNQDQPISEIIKELRNTGNQVFEAQDLHLVKSTPTILHPDYILILTIVLALLVIAMGLFITYRIKCRAPPPNMTELEMDLYRQQSKPRRLFTNFRNIQRPPAPIIRNSPSLSRHNLDVETPRRDVIA